VIVAPSHKDPTMSPHPSPRSVRLARDEGLLSVCQRTLDKSPPRLSSAATVTPRLAEHLSSSHLGQAALGLLDQPVPCIWDQGLTGLSPTKPTFIVSHFLHMGPKSSLDFPQEWFATGLPRPARAPCRSFVCSPSSLKHHATERICAPHLRPKNG
jgi:hypothetical protein